jgi:hypothetical protein
MYKHPLQRFAKILINSSAIVSRTKNDASNVIRFYENKFIKSLDEITENIISDGYLYEYTEKVYNMSGTKSDVLKKLQQMDIYDKAKCYYNKISDTYMSDVKYAITKYDGDNIYIMIYEYKPCVYNSSNNQLIINKIKIHN